MSKNKTIIVTYLHGKDTDEFAILADDPNSPDAVEQIQRAINNLRESVGEQ